MDGIGAEVSQKIRVSSLMIVVMCIGLLLRFHGLKMNNA